MKNSIIYILLIVMVFSCHKDKEDIIIVDIPFVPPIIEGYTPEVEMISSSVIGEVINYNNQPIKNAEVTLGTYTTTTDNFGHFFFKNITMNAKGTLVKVNKSGYFEGSRRFYPDENTTNRVKIELISKSYSIFFDNADGGLYDLPNGGTISFEPNSIVDELTQEAYNGVVSVAVMGIDPLGNAFRDQMPGDLIGVGVSSLNEETALSNFGVLAIELTGTEEQKLNLAEGIKAEIKMLPTSGLSNYPSTLTSYSYHETYGVWAEESVATFDGTYYVFDATHFSFWGCNASLDHVFLSFQLVDVNGNPLNNYMVQLFDGDFSYAYGRTASNGVVFGAVPKDIILNMVIKDVCNGIIYNEQIGPFGDDTDLGSITLEGTNVNSTSIFGDLFCLGNAIESGMIKISYSGVTIYEYIEDGHFDISFTTCDGTGDIEVQGVNLDDLTVSQLTNVTQGMANDLDNLDVCLDNLVEYIFVVVDGQPVIFSGMLVPFIQGENSSASGINTVTGEGVILAFFGDVVGDYSGELNDIQSLLFPSYNWNITGELDVFNVTVLDNFPGGYLEGNFLGTGLNSGGGGANAIEPPEEVEIHGKFKIAF